MTAVTVGDFSERNTKITSADARRVKDLWLEPGDILIQRSNAPELVGTSRLYRGDKNYAIFPDLMIRVRLKEEADPRFIELVLQSEPLRQYFKSRAKGMSGSMPKIDQETISEAPIPLFDIHDQRRIVAEIEKQFTRLEAGVAALRRVQANLKRYRAAVLKAACEGRLVPTEAELARAEGRPFETGQQLLARILTERRLNWQGRGKYKEPATPNTVKIDPLPEGWTWASVECLSSGERNAIVDGPFGSSLKLTDYIEPPGVPVLTTANLRGDYSPGSVRYISAKKFIELQRSEVRGGDILMAKIGSCGLSGVYPEDMPSAIIPANLLKMTVRKEIPKRYVLHYFRSKVFLAFLKEITTATAQPAFNVTKFRDLPVPLPPLTEQIRIVAEVERRLSMVEELEAVVTTNLQRATRLRQAILARSFSSNKEQPR